MFFEAVSNGPVRVVGSEAKAPQGHRREPFLRNFLGEQKVPRRRQDARRAEKRGPQAQREQRPEGEKARAAWPIKTFSIK